ncbi:MAG: succinyl-diaminopimelate desuccinylase [SAR86 cluster bacterium]|uniref:Succinyl-diaminopimelate desuccinylase n=1 Tax=SAR86 cluster bacterium TaxID=2030880 RepID=A0A520M6D7_9GAMM|nr:MAG: succinyl-diaminopimelate desuccinylase [SAR86 cluster bacterium]
MIDLAKSLIEIKSISPEDKGCFDIVEKYLDQLKFKTERINYLNMENLYSTIGSKGPLFCFLGHTDVVPSGPEELWDIHPFKPEVLNDHLVGRGAADMKGAVATFLVTAKEFLEKYPNPNFRICIFLNSNEEGEPADGKIDKIIKDLQVKGEHIDYCLVGEASSSKKLADTIRLGRRGSLSGALTIKGKQGHVAYPDKVNNPIHISGEIIKSLKEVVWDNGNEFFQPTSFQISNINSGTGATNVVPGHLEMKFNLRFSSESTEESLKEKILEIFKEHNIDYEIEWTLNAVPFITEKTFFKDIVIKSINSITGSTPDINNGGGTSDGRWIAPMGSEIIELGPINETIHQINEKVNIDDLEALKDIYKEILINLNQA